MLDSKSWILLCLFNIPPNKFEPPLFQPMLTSKSISIIHFEISWITELNSFKNVVSLVAAKLSDLNQIGVGKRKLLSRSMSNAMKLLKRNLICHGMATLFL